MGKKLKHLFHGTHGTVTLEQVMLGTLITVACLVAVIVLSRTLIRGMDIEAKVLSGKKDRVVVAAETYREDQKKENIIARLYHKFITGED